MAINHFVGLGRLTADPVTTTTASGKTVASFTIAIDRRFGKETDFLNCIAWEKTGQFISDYFKKGSSIAIVGSVQTRSWEKDGKKQYATEIIVCEASFAGDKKSDTVPTVIQSQSEPKFETLADGDELPF